MTKFDFSTNENKASRFSNDEYSKAKAGVGTMFFSGKSRPSSVQVVRAYLSASNWISSVQEFEDSAEIRFTNNNGNSGDTFRITIEDARKLLEALPSIISDAEQIKEALVKVLPVEEAEDFDDDNDDDDHDD